MRTKQTGVALGGPLFPLHVEAMLSARLESSHRHSFRKLRRSHRPSATLPHGRSRAILVCSQLPHQDAVVHPSCDLFPLSAPPLLLVGQIRNIIKLPSLFDGHNLSKGCPTLPCVTRTMWYCVRAPSHGTSQQLTGYPSAGALGHWW